MRHTEILLTIKLQQQLFVDPKRVKLLKAIAECGSINQAAKNAKVSYKSAWDHLEAMNNISPKPLLERNIGGKNGGGTQLTNYAQRLLQLYDLLEQTQTKAFEVLQDETLELNSLLAATAQFSLQSSARNQLFGKVKKLDQQTVLCQLEIEIEGLNETMLVSITEKSAQRLKLTLGKEVMLMIKAPWVQVTRQQQPQLANQFQAQIAGIVDNENVEEIQLKVGNLDFCATLPKNENFKIQDQVWLHVEPEQIVLVTLY